MKKSKKKKHLSKIGVLVIILLPILMIMSVVLFCNSKKLKVDYDDNVTISINTEAYNTDYIHNIKNGKLITAKEQIDTSKLESKSIEFIVKNYFKKEIKYSFKVTIIDQEPPVINYSKELEIEEGEKIDLLANVKVTDNSNEEIITTIEGEYDINKSGEYDLQYIATDSSGNTTKEDFRLKVKAKKTNSNSSPNNNSNSNKPSSGSSTNNGSSNNSSGEVHFKTSKGFEGITKNGITYIDGYLVVNKTYSLPKSFVPTNVYSGNPTSTSTTQCATCIEKTAYNKWLEMKAAAKLDGLELKIVSGYRSYTLQSNLYNRYVSRSGKAAADTFSARPGYSEHQSGLAFDINYPGDSFNNTAEAKWLASNAYKYGYILRYPEGKSNETGYKYESWHYRYVGTDLSYKLYNNGDWITMEDYFGITSEYAN